MIYQRDNNINHEMFLRLLCLIGYVVGASSDLVLLNLLAPTTLIVVSSVFQLTVPPVSNGTCSMVENNVTQIQALCPPPSTEGIGTEGIFGTFNTDREYKSLRVFMCLTIFSLIRDAARIHYQAEDF